MMINDFVAIALPPNMTCNNAMTGQEIYHQSFSYLSTSPSMMGKFITPEIMMITTINCLMISFIRYHFAIMMIPTKKHNAKKTQSPISPNAILAYVLRNIITGDHSAKYSEKKKSDPKTVMLIPSLYLFNTTLFFLLLDKTNYKTIKKPGCYRLLQIVAIFQQYGTTCNNMWRSPRRTCIQYLQFKSSFSM